MAFLPGTASLVEEVDKKLLVVLRDGRKLIGTLRTFDQFANIVLEDTVERIYVKNAYGEKKMGLYLVRGENVVLLGEIDLDKEAEVLHNRLTKLGYEEAQKLYDEEQALKDEQSKLKRKAMLESGIAIDPYTLTDNLLAFE